MFPKMDDEHCADAFSYLTGKGDKPLSKENFKALAFV